MPKEYEPLIVAILTDKDLNDVDRIYEALYVWFKIILYHVK
jgi:hypothetical protein